MTSLITRVNAFSFSCSDLKFVLDIASSLLTAFGLLDIRAKNTGAANTAAAVPKAPGAPPTAKPPAPNSVPTAPNSFPLKNRVPAVLSGLLLLQRKD